MKLLSESELESSCIVANNRMNRERVATGTNGYETDLQFDPIQFLIEKHQRNGQVAWLDLCCGRGKAIIETGQTFFELGLNVNTHFLGVDLVGMFDPVPDELDFVTFTEATLHQWTTSQTFDLITCVHGLHYVGDKLGLIKRATSMLRPLGEFVANLDPSNLRMISDSPILNTEIEFDFANYLQTLYSSFDIDSNILKYANGSAATQVEKHRQPDSSTTSAAAVAGSQNAKMKFIGANDQAGPNYTGQEAVNSHYRIEPG